jgi:hypothetical protein
MARATLEPYVGGSGQNALLKQGVLADALRAFAKAEGGTLDALIRWRRSRPIHSSSQTARASTR